MPIYKPTELKHFLATLGVTPKRGLSQNFLIDGNIISKIIATADVCEGDVVLEIGPGPGALTEGLLLSGAHVIAVERDQKLAETLNRLPHSPGQLETFCDDILAFPIEETLRARLKGNQKAKVVANLPYHLTSPIIERLAPLHTLFSSLTLMVQDEVACRYAAKPGNKDYSSFSIFLQMHADVRYAFAVPKGCFFPEPSVGSAIVTLALHPLPALSDTEAFFKLTRSSFEQRRKMLKVSLKKLYPSELVMQKLTDIGCSPLARPETLSPEQFIALFESLQK